MALVPSTLAAAIKGALDAAMEASEDPEANVVQIRNDYANAVADAIDEYIKTLTITIGIGSISVSGPGGASTNPAPIVISNTPPNSLS